MSKDKNKTYLAHTVGRRKSSVARVYVGEGSGEITVNGREYKNYFSKPRDRYVVNQPLSLLDVKDNYSIKINVAGGGSTGQSGAVRLGIARALEKINSAYREKLKKAGFLTRDPRKVERKKYGLAGARKAYQFSKR
jgi:small subunit ribosomal protein S9